MIALINPIVIVKDHIASLRDSANTFVLCVIFFIIPLFLSFLLVKFSIYPSSTFLNAFLTAVSIISALMFSLLFIVLDTGKKVKEDLQRKKESPLNQKRYKLLKQLLANISFSILLGIGLIIITLLALLLKSFLLKNELANVLRLREIWALIFYYLSMVYLLTLLQILKRSYRLLEHELSMS